MGGEMNNSIIIAMFELTSSLAKKSRFSNEQEFMTYQKGLEFAESYYRVTKEEIEKVLNNDHTTEDISGA